MINISIRSGYKLQIRPNEDITRTLKAKQRDTKTRFLDVTLLNDDGLPYDLTGCEIRFSAKKPSGLSIFNTAEITDAENGRAVIELTNQALAEPGRLQSEISIFGPDGEEILTTRKFDIEVQAAVRNDAAIESSNEFTVLTEALYDVREFKDVTRSIDDKLGNPDDGITPPMEQAGETLFYAMNKFYNFLLDNSAAAVVETVREILGTVKNNLPWPGKAVFISNGTFAVPDGVTEIFITACGGGGGGSEGSATNQRGGNGGTTIIGNLITLPGGVGAVDATNGAAGGNGGGAGGNPGIAGFNGARGGADGGGGSLGGGGGGAGSLGSGESGGSLGRGGESLYCPGFAATYAHIAGSGALGGGGGGWTGGGGGGGGAAIVKMPFSVNPGQNIAITVGASGNKSPIGRSGAGGNGIVIIEWRNGGDMI